MTILQPNHSVVENVAGHLSLRGFSQSNPLSLDKYHQRIKARLLRRARNDTLENRAGSYTARIKSETKQKHPDC